MTSGGEEFDPESDRRLDHSKMLCNKVLLKYKGIEAASDTDFRRGHKECPPLLVFSKSVSKLLIR